MGSLNKRDGVSWPMIAAVYARKSTDQSGVADDQKSVARQIEHARAFAASRGWAVADAHVYVDDGISGAEFANRPGFLRLMNALKPRAPFQLLIMSEVSRLGREQIETAYALKQLSVAGVRVFGYLEGREVLMESATDKFLLGAVTFAADLEREKARQRTYDAMLQKARAGHVTGGRVFGYDNAEVSGVTGRRSHVERRINQAEAAIVRRLFELSAAGHGVKAIAKILNADGAGSPRAQLGRSQSWAPSSVRAVLFRTLYRGVVTWNRTRKRNRWGQHQQAARPSTDWLEVPAPELRIVSEALWQGAHARLTSARAIYLKGNRGRAGGRPTLGSPSKYLLTNLAVCGCCGNALQVRSRGHGNGRKAFYGCGAYHDRGRTVCTNNADVPMSDADEIVIEALLDDVLDESMLRDAVDEALRLLQAADGAGERTKALEAERGKVERERDRLVAAVASGGELSGLLEALQAREARLTGLGADLAAVRTQAPLRASEAARVRDELTALASSWRRVLADDPEHARPIVSSLLAGRVSFTPTERKRWIMRGEGTISGLFERVFPVGGTSPAGTNTEGKIAFERAFRAA